MANTEQGIGILTGDQRKGIVALSVPLFIAILIQQLNNLVDSVWVSGLGAGPMAAIGLVSPLYIAVIGVGNGLGIGISSAISRRIGANQRSAANQIASQGVLLALIISAVLTVLLLATAEPVLMVFGAGDTIDECMAYAIPIYISTVFLVMSGVLSSMLRGEGAARRSMYVLCIGAALNIVLDPIMIYTMGMGAAGAAWATSIALAVSTIIPLHWYFVKKDTFVSISKPAGFSREVVSDILSVGLPEMLELSLMSVFNIFLNYYVVVVGGTGAVAIYSAAWRVLFLLITPAQAIGGALVSMCSAEYGMGRMDQIKDGFAYSMRISIGIMVVLSMLLALFTVPIAGVFTPTDDLAYMQGQMEYLMIVMAAFLPAFSLVYTGSSLMQALKKAGQAMINTVLRNVLITAMFAFIAFNAMGLHSLWWALFAGEIAGGLMMCLHAFYVLKDVSRRWRKCSAEPAHTL